MLRLNIDARLVKKLLDENLVVEDGEGGFHRESIIIDVNDVNFYRKDNDTGEYQPVSELFSNL